MGGKDNWLCHTHPRCRSTGCLKGQGGAVDFVGGDAVCQRHNLFHKVESSRIKFDVAPTGCTDPCPNQIATLSTGDGLEI